MTERDPGHGDITRQSKYFCFFWFSGFFGPGPPPWARTQGSSQARAQSSSQARAQGSSKARAQSSSQARAQGSSQARAQGSSQARAQSSSQARAQDSSQARGPVSLFFLVFGFFGFLVTNHG